MAVSYDILIHLLIDRQMNNSEIINKAGFSRECNDADKAQKIHLARQY